jgi:L-asparaginase II
MEILAHVTRGGISESRHAGFIAVADATGQARLTSGPLDQDRVSFLRSAAKPFQAIPLVESGAADAFGLTPAELALACASHSGQPEHTRQVQAMLDKGGLNADQLLCGAHYPYNQAAADEMKRAGQHPNNLHSNCSGKHTGMLLTCKHMGWPTESYTEPEHPLQQAILKAVADFAGLRPSEIATGRDGCSVVCFGLTTLQMATAFARLGSPAYWEDQANPARAKAVSRLTQAMYSYPFNVGGTGRGDTDLMESAPGGRIFSKAGAEAVWCMGFPEKGLALALKVEDGANRAHPAILSKALRLTGLLNEAEIAAYEAKQLTQLKNVRGIVVGDYQPVFELKSPEDWARGCC